MTHRFGQTAARLAAALALACGLSACGVKGDLRPADPIWGDKNRTPPPLPEPYPRAPEDEADTSIGRLPGS